MENRQLRHFVAVFETGSITDAARRVHLAQPSLSASLGQLEEDLRAQLFHRHKKGVTPTAEGERLYPLAKRLLGEFQALTTLFRDTPERTTLTVGLMAALDAARVRRLLEQIRASLPNVRLRLVEAQTEADFRLVSESFVPPGERFRPLWEEAFVLALPPDDPLVLKETVALADLEGQPLIHRCQCELAGEVEGALRNQRITPDIVAQVQNEEWALELVAAGVGAAILPEGCIGHRRDVVARELDGTAALRRVGLAHPPQGTIPQGIEGLFR